MKNSYLSNYIKLYFWQFVAILLNFVSMLIVLPLLAKNREFFGIYSFCMSLVVFLSYADIGFISSGMKYASEFFSRDDLEQEVGVAGFSLAVLTVGMIPYIGAMLWFWKDPSIILSELSPVSVEAASDMFLILAVFAPVYILQKAGTIIYGVRVEDYVPRQINIIGHLIKIGSVFYFFHGDKTDIVGYFLTFQVVNLTSFLVAFVLAGYRYQYPLYRLIKSTRFSGKYFDISKSLAIASFTATLAWVIYYELDNMAIGKILGITSVATYAVGFSLLSFLRSIYGVIFSPLTARFNHFVGLQDLPGLKEFYARIVRTLFPLLTFPLIAGLLLMDKLVLTWVGGNYSDSFQIARLLVATISFAFVTYPAGILLMALEKTNVIYKLNMLLVGVFWGGVLLTINMWGLFSFALFKLIAYLVSVIVLTVFSFRFLEISFGGMIKQNLLSILIALVILLCTTLPFSGWLAEGKSVVNFIQVVLWGAVSTALGWSSYLVLNKPFRSEVLFVLNRVQQRFKK